MAPGVFSFDAILRGEDRAVAKAISAIENDSPEAPALLEFLAKVPKRAHRVGFTGPQASGKSTLIGCVVDAWFAGGKNIGVIAIDPSSHKSGGAFLGDRVRMPQRNIGEKFFFRSMATRGNEHGIVNRLDSIMDVLDAAGKTTIAVETIGTSQNEIAIRKYVATLVVVLLPTGDEITYSKAGLMEAGDIFILNYGDLPVADSSFRQLREVLSTQEKSAEPANASAKGWTIPGLRTIAAREEGIQEVIVAIQAHWEFLRAK